MFKPTVGRPSLNSSARNGLRLIPLLLLLLWLQGPHRPEAQARSRRPSSSQPTPQQQSAVAQSAPELTTLEPGRAIERELSGEEKHVYQITLTDGQYASVVVEQRRIDVVVQLLAADGKLIAEFDSEGRSVGEEKVGVVAETAGSYRLLVKAKYPKLPAGRYEIRLTETRAADDEDRLLYDARKLLAESARLADAGKYLEALPPGEKALESYERVLGAGHPDLVYPLLNLTSISYYKGDYAKGEAYSRRGLLIAEKSMGAEHLLVARLISFLALIASARGDEAGAETLHQRALAIREKALGPDHPVVISSVSSLGVIYRTRGDFVRAEQYFQRAMTTLEKVLGEEHNNFAGALNYLAGVYREKGDYAKAEPLYQRSLAIREKTNDRYLPAALNNLANLYNDMGEYEKAEPLYERSIAIKEKAVGPDHPDVANSRSSLGFIYFVRGDYAKAEALYLSSLAAIEKARGPNHHEVGWNVSYLADLYFATDDYAKAEPLYQRALSILEAANGPNYYHLADILIGLAKISTAQGKPAQAVAYQSRANAIIEYNLTLNLAVGSERQKLAYLAKLPEQISQAVSLHVRSAADDRAARELAATAVLERKGRVQDALSGSLDALRSRSGAEDQALLDELNEVTSRLARLALNGPQGASADEHQKKVRSLEEQRERLEGEINSRSAEFRSQKQPVTLDSVRRAIPEGAALVEFAVYRPLDPKASNNKAARAEPRYVAYVIRSRGEVRWAELGAAKEIDGAVEALRQSLGDPHRRDVHELARAADEQLMRPARALAGDAAQLLISPDGELNLIPFEALVDERGHYLVESYAFTYLTSGRDLLRMQVARESKGQPTIVANPSLGEPAALQLARVSATCKPAAPERARRSVTAARDLSEVYFAPLTATADEASAIKKLFHEADLLTGGRATESALKKINAPRVLHIATHGFFLQDAETAADGVQIAARGAAANAGIENPLLRSGLALAGANVRGGVGDDGILTALEASGLNLWGTKLVVLSACDTGLGEVRNGEGVYGLRRAFVLAGAESLLMSLLPVSDYSTPTLMTSYYRNLKQGFGRGDSLRRVRVLKTDAAGGAFPRW